MSLKCMEPMTVMYNLGGVYTAGGGGGDVFLSNVRCSGDESKLEECPSDPLSSSTCGYNQDAGVICIST